jgi:hypothetical protein
MSHLIYNENQSPESGSAANSRKSELMCRVQCDTDLINCKQFHGSSYFFSCFGFPVLAAVTMKDSISRDIRTCSPVKFNRKFYKY